jgi:methylenetetrahydrofolate reductase (NADPH)
MSIKNLWKEKKHPTISFEFFPARDEKAAKKLNKAIDSLAALKPDFVSVTFGAGGGTREGSFRLAEKLKNDKGLEVLPYLAAYGLGPSDIQAILDEHRSLGIENIFCVRGDEPAGEANIAPHPDGFPHASDLLAFVRGHYDFFLGAAGYPESHRESESKEKDIEYLKLKIQNGAGFIITQYVYDNRYFFDFLDRCRAAGVDVPIIAGVMPVYSVKMMESLASLCGATITRNLREGLAKLPPDDKNAVTGFGVEFALQQCRELLKHGVQGIHFYTMDKSKTLVEVINRLKEEGLL